jgi:signal transduction histidine kinase/ActR/RegA family two-component response regulator
MEARNFGLARTIATALLAVLAAAVVRQYFHARWDETIPYTPFYPAIVVATMYGRLTGGLVATIAGALAASFWIYPIGQWRIDELNDLIGLALFIAVSGIVVALCEGMLRARQRAEIAAEERQRALDGEQEARRQAEEANRLKDRFLASVSHELRTPLQAILGWADLLARGDLDEADRTQGLQVIQRNTRTQSRLVEDLLDMSRITAGKMRISSRLINPQHSIEAAIQTVAIAAQAKEVTIERSYSDRASVVHADPDRLQQIVWNLLSNSIKFSPPGSCIHVSLERIENDVQIAIRDEGRGIQPGDLDAIFDPFHQIGTDGRRYRGLGLGLSIVRHLVELHGGSVRAHSEGLGRGATMTVTLPSFVGRSVSGATAPPADAQLSGIRVLVVDDDSATCELVRRILVGCRADVAVAGSAGQAISLVQEFQPHVLVSDIGLPDRDGYALLREIRRRQDGPHRLPAMALSAYSSLEAHQRSFEAGYRLHLTKPVEARTLTDAVAELAAREGGQAI